MVLLKLENVFYSIKSKRGGNEHFNILMNISFHVEEGEILGICGESGGGKSTLAKMITGIIKPNSGNIVFNFNKDNDFQRRNPIQILFQNHNEILNPFRTVRRIIDEGLKISGINNDKIDNERTELLNSIGLSEELSSRKGYQLSGGEQQRAALARLLSVKPKVLILDEPFSAQDVESQLNFVKLFKKLNKDFNLTMICISHDLKILRNLSDRIIVLKDGEIVEINSTREIFQKPKEDYTKFLLSAEALNLTYEELQNQSKS